jgi:hypothetical protein
VAPRRAPANRTRGGPVISPARRTRLITGLAAIAALVGADTYGLAARGKYELAELACAALSLLALCAALAFHRVSPAIWAAAFGAGCYLAGRSGHNAVDSRSALVGLLLLLSAELASWSVDSSARLHVEWRVHAQRAVVLLAIAVCSLAADFFVLAGAGISASGEVAVAAAGSAAAVAAVALVALAARR